MKAVFTIEQVEDKMVVTVEAAEIVFKQQEKEEIDWSKPQPFPEYYDIPDDVMVKLMTLDGSEITVDSLVYCYPINPTDHPLHPDFKGNK